MEPTPDLSQRVRQMIAQGALAAAGQELAGLLGDYPRAAELWLLQAELAVLNQQPELAQSGFERALTLNPGYASAHAGLGRLLLSQGAWDSAREHFEAARAFEPESLIHTQALIELYLSVGERQQALVFLKDALAQAPESAPLFALLGQVLYLFGRWPEARAALYQALELDPACEAASLALLRLALRLDQQGEAKKIADLLAKVPVSAGAWPQLAYLMGCSAYAQGDLPEARRLWRAAGDQGSVAAVLQLTLAGPLVSQSAEERLNWQALALKSASFLEFTSLAGLPLEWPQLAYAPESDDILTCLGRALQAVLLPLQLEREPHAGFRIGLICSNLETPERQDWIVEVLSQKTRAELDWMVFYLHPGELPEALMPWASACFQLPDHAEALSNRLDAFELDALIYLDLEQALYPAALRCPAQLQLLAPTWPQSSGLPTLGGLADSSLLARPRSPEPAARTDWNLPRLGHLYLCASDPRYWLPEADATILELLNLDRKAFVLGLQRPGTQLHTRVMQRHAQSLGDRAHRVRWLDSPPEQLPALISQIDALIELPETGSAWASFQALSQGVPVIACPGRSLRSHLSGLWLSRMGLSELVAADGSQLAQSACHYVTDRKGRAMLKERLQTARPLLLDSAAAVRALEDGIYKELSQL